MAVYYAVLALMVSDGNDILLYADTVIESAENLAMCHCSGIMLYAVDSGRV